MTGRFRLLLVVVLMLYGCNGNRISESKIEIGLGLRVDAMVPSFDLRDSLIRSSNTFAIDHKDNLYFLDSGNHRVLVYNQHGKFVKQIGGIGQGADDLFCPLGVIANGETIYVLDNSGHDFKVFTAEGKQLENFGIDKITECASFSVSEDFYVFNNIPRENVPSNVGLFLLVSGMPQSRKRMGATINTKEGLAFSVFNRAFLSAKGGSIFGAFKSYPAVFRYDSEGKEIFFKNFKENDEIKNLEKWGKRRNVDIPEKVRGNKNVTALIYCDGFGVNGRGESFSALNVNRGSDGVILVFDGAGKIMRKIVPQYEKRRVRIERILVQDENLYTLVSAKGRKGIYLVNINLKEVK